jgi:hypothetical protein
LSERARLILRLLTAFVVGVVMLTLEIAYTRVISFKLFYFYTYFVIGLALLGLGSASAVVALSVKVRSLSTVELLQRVAPAAAGVGLLGYLIVARLPMTTDQIWNGSTTQTVGQIVRLLALSVSLTAVFFALGVLLASLIVAEVEHVRRIYFWDLAGAALGCLVAVPLQLWLGPPAMIVTSLVLLASLGLVAALMSNQRVALAGGLLVAIIAGGLVCLNVDVRTDNAKNLRDDTPVEYSAWGPVFRVDVSPFMGPMVLHHDGLLGSTIWPYDGTRETTARFDTDMRQIPFAPFAGEEGPRVLIIGAAGGNEIQASLTYGASHIDAVELNPLTVDLLRGKYREFSGGIVDHPNVNYVQGDGRTFLARSNQDYDLIWFVAPDSYAASNNATAGAFVLSESYLYTSEMIAESFDHLTERGAVVAQFGDQHLETQPVRTARYVVTSRDALDGKVDEVTDHIAVIANSGAHVAFDRISTTMLFRSPVDAATAGNIEDAVGRVRNNAGERTATTLYMPGAVDDGGILATLAGGSTDAVAEIVDNYPVEITAIDDNRPFFWHFTNFTDAINAWDDADGDNEIAIGERLLLVLVAISAVVAGVVLWLPFALTRRRAGAGLVAGRGRMFVYFACLGLGFMMIEISMIQRFALLLGYPTLSLSVSLFTLLIATAVGARLSAVLSRWGNRALPAVAVLLIVLSTTYMATAASITDTALAWEQWARITLVFALLFPVGLLLGVFLPTGMDVVVEAADTAGADRGRVVAWCWAVNGFFSVLGSTLTTITSMAFGFNRALQFGLVLYVVAVVVMGLLGRARTTGEELVEPVREPATV